MTRLVGLGLVWGWLRLGFELVQGWLWVDLGKVRWLEMPASC